MANHSKLKYGLVGKYEAWMFSFVFLAIVVRFALIYFHWPPTNSDEGNMGLLARHIAYHGEWPIFFYGQPYMGPLEGYLAAPLFAWLGASLFVLRLPLLLLFALFMLNIYYLVRLLYTRALALFTIFLFCFGSVEVLGRQIKAVGEYPETEVFAAAICLTVVWLALTMPVESIDRLSSLLRVAVYSFLGFIIGISLWVDLLILPFVCMGILFLLLFCRRDLLSWMGFLFICGCLIGLLPLLIYNIMVPFEQNSFAVLLKLHSAGANDRSDLLPRLVGIFGVSLPNAMGFDPLCPQNTFPFFGTNVDVPCVLAAFSWSAGYLLLWIFATTAAVFSVLHVWKYQCGTFLHSQMWTYEQRLTLIRECGRLVVLICAIGTLYLYSLSPVSALTPGPSSRYLMCMMISLPAVLWPLWTGIYKMFNLSSIAMTVFRLTILFVVSFVFVAGTYRIFTYYLPPAQQVYTQWTDEVKRLQSVHVRYIYSDYWTCNNLIFISQEQLICGVLNADLSPALNRYPPYWEAIKRTMEPAYIFQYGSNYQIALEKQLHAQRTFEKYQKIVEHEYVLYVLKTQR